AHGAQRELLREAPEPAELPGARGEGVEEEGALPPERSGSAPVDDRGHLVPCGARGRGERVDDRANATKGAVVRAEEEQSHVGASVHAARPHISGGAEGGKPLSGPRRRRVRPG